MSGPDTQEPRRLPMSRRLAIGFILLTAGLSGASVTLNYRTENQINGQTPLSDCNTTPDQSATQSIDLTGNGAVLGGEKDLFGKPVGDFVRITQGPEGGLRVQAPARTVDIFVPPESGRPNTSGIIYNSERRTVKVSNIGGKNYLVEPSEDSPGEYTVTISCVKADKITA